MKQLIVDLLKKEIHLKKEEIQNLIEIPPSPEMGDYSLPCFSLSKILHRSVYPKAQNEGAKKSPNQIAEELKSKIKLPKQIKDVKVINGYLNFFIDKNILCEKIVKEILSKKEKFGKAKVKKEKIMIEFSQANTHKAFHIGHIRGTSIGESLARIMEFYGNKTIRANYQGDTGMHVAKWLWCYKKYHSREQLKDDELWIASIYVDAVKRLTQKPELQEEVNKLNKKLEDKKDKQLNLLWKKTRSLSLKSFEKIYSQLNTHFDKYFFESEVEKKGKEIAEKLLKKGIAKKSEGAVIVDLEKFNLGVWVLLRSDMTVLYSAKDLALAEEKFRKFKIDKNIYVVADEQNLHMQQLFKTLELMGFKSANKCRHVSYGIVRLPTGKMSSRTGDNILYSDFINEIKKYAKKRIKERLEKISEKELEKRAEKISIAAIKYAMLKQNPNKNIIFNKKESLNFEGDTGPYLLYSYARASSILRKAKIKQVKNFKIKDLNNKEVELAKKLSQFPEIVFSSYNNLNSSSIANYSYQLSKIFSEFYHECPVINSDNEQFRLALVNCFRYVLKNSLNLLGINILEEM